MFKFQKASVLKILKILSHIVSVKVGGILKGPPEAGGLKFLCNFSGAYQNWMTNNQFYDAGGQDFFVNLLSPIC